MLTSQRLPESCQRVARLQVRLAQGVDLGESGFTVWKVSLFETANKREEHGLKNIFIHLRVRDQGTKC